ncbi:MAG: exosortase/archaeosortase family protein, partial [Nitrospirota bacterium]|nr:exosortase/archaeosortase family protein [Nitrospirota bacterium]
MDRTLSKEFPQHRTGKTPDEIASAEAFSSTSWTNWYVVLVIGALVVLLAGLYHETLFKLGQQWNNDPDYSHGFLVPVLVGYFVWERWDRLKATRITPSLWGVALLGGGLLMLVIGSIGAELYLQRSSLIVVIAGLVLLIMGREALKALMFPIAFMLFMVPLPAIVVNAVAFPLQLFAARTAEFCLFNFGIPVLREGNVI